MDLQLFDKLEMTVQRSGCYNYNIISMFHCSLRPPPPPPPPPHPSLHLTLCPCNIFIQKARHLFSSLASPPSLLLLPNITHPLPAEHPLSATLTGPSRRLLPPPTPPSERTLPFLISLCLPSSAAHRSLSPFTALTHLPSSSSFFHPVVGSSDVEPKTLPPHLLWLNHLLLILHVLMTSADPPPPPPTPNTPTPSPNTLPFLW